MVRELFASGCGNSLQSCLGFKALKSTPPFLRTEGVAKSLENYEGTCQGVVFVVVCYGGGGGGRYIEDAAIGSVHDRFCFCGFACDS